MAAFPLFRPFRRRSCSEPAELIRIFLSRPEHAWIAADRALLRCVAMLLSLLPAADLFTILEERGLLLLYCNQRMSCAFHQFRNREIVLIFPELRKLLTSAQYHQGHAVLAHELAHVLLGHSREAVDPLQAQLEADRYALELGLGEDLVKVLSAEETSDELAERLVALTPR